MIALGVVFVSGMSISDPKIPPLKSRGFLTKSILTNVDGVTPLPRTEFCKNASKTPRKQGVKFRVLQDVPSENDKAPKETNPRGLLLVSSQVLDMLLEVGGEALIFW